MMVGACYKSKAGKGDKGCQTSIVSRVVKEVSLRRCHLGRDLKEMRECAV